MTIKVALSIAGSDSGGGAGIQSDIKTIASLGVFPCTAITAITAQNTSRVTHVFPVPADSVRKQIQSVVSDMHVHAIKIGMVYNKATILEVSNFLKTTHIPTVLDPILAAGTGFKLLLEEFLEIFKSKLIPLSDIVTPNLVEAEKISGVRIRNESNMIESAMKMIELGAKNVIVKGGHLGKAHEAVDILVNKDGGITRISNSRIKVNETHGSGCNFSAAITAFLARKYSVTHSCILANKYVQESMSNLIKLGYGIPVNAPIFSIYDDASRYRTTLELTNALDSLMLAQRFSELIPETHSNMVYALPHATTIKDVAGVDGRIVKLTDRIKQAGPVRFGCSKHVSSAVITFMKYNPLMRSAINIKFNERLLKCCRSLYPTTEYKRSEEPLSVKEAEGMTTPWGVKQALLENLKSEVIFHSGDIGKEAMILIFASNPSALVTKVKQILKIY
jgi:hydroxymethylpyrimidine kinase / phosphomethylpyrimidine kinase / thiamine-phosphate diphosphorylase